MAKKRTVQARLLVWQCELGWPKYSEEFASRPKAKWNFHKVAYWLATDLFDRDFDLNKESWETLDKIQQIFGKRMRNRVLFNIFNRKHDT